MPAASILKVARTSAGFAIRVEGRGNAGLSTAAKQFIEQSLAEPGQTMSIDLTSCEHLDSTFLGLLLNVQKRFTPARISISAAPALVEKCFAPIGLSHVLAVTADAPQPIGDWVAVDPSPVDAAKLARHMMETHRQLAEIKSPHQAAFASIANQLERELTAK